MHVNVNGHGLSHLLEPHLPKSQVGKNLFVTSLDISDMLDVTKIFTSTLADFLARGLPLQRPDFSRFRGIFLKKLQNTGLVAPLPYGKSRIAYYL